MFTNILIANRGINGRAANVAAKPNCVTSEARGD